MRVALSLCAFAFVTVAVTFSASKVRDLDDASDLFATDEPFLLADTSDESIDGDIGEFPDDLELFNPRPPSLDDSASLLSDDVVMSDNIDSPCQNPARKRDHLDNNPILGR